MARGLSLDLLTRVRNIKWQVGAIFVVVGRDNVYYYKATSKTAPPDQRKLTIPDSPLGPVGPFSASSYTLISGKPPKPTFLVSGLVDHEDVDEQSALAAVVLASRNGLDWHHTFLSETGFDIQSDSGSRKPWDTLVNALVRSTDGFFYHDQRVARPGMAQVMTPTGFNQWVHEQVYRSPTGETWEGPISDDQIWYGAETMGYRSVFPPSYCTHNNCKDTLDQNVPDGFMNVSKNALMRPKTPITINYGIPSFDYGESNVIEKLVPSIVNIIVPVLEFVDCVAGANGIWMAGGRSGAAISFDVGATWTKIPFIDDSVRSISAAPQQDIK